MNVHHLELFYYVARFGGVSAAARRMPYGIQQPAISAQVIQLEDRLGSPLFARQPFKLTKAGEELYRFVEPFFGKLGEVEQRLRGGCEVSLRIGALEAVLRDYLPRLLKTMRCDWPGLNFKLAPGRIDQIEAAVLAQEIDIGIAPLLGKRPLGIRQRIMTHLPMALAVPKNSPITAPEDLWRQDRIREPLICGPTDNAVTLHFQVELQKRKIEWFPSMELTSQETIIRYAVEGFGIGLVLFEPGGLAPKGIRLLPLAHFPTVPYGLLWMGVLSPLQKAFIQAAEAVASAMPPPVKNGPSSGPSLSARAKPGLTAP